MSIDNLILNLATISHTQRNNTPQLIQFLLNHMLLIKTVHTKMLERDFYKESLKNIQGTRTITLEELVITQDHHRRIAVLNYYQLLGLLNQLGRTLNGKYGLSLNRFPRFYNIRFYRNKVTEHWDDYLAHGANSGIRFQSGKASIPDTTHNYPSPYERNAIAKKIQNQFKKNGIPIRIPKRFIEYTAVSSEEKYSKYIFSKLKKLDHKLAFYKSHSKLIKLLFSFGFPTPICDVEKYLEELCAYLEKVLIKRNYIPSS